MVAPVIDRPDQAVATRNISGQANCSRAKIMQQTMLRPLLAAAQTNSGMLSVQRI